MTSSVPPIWISAAETSADVHGASLVQALNRLAPNVPLLGMGGAGMRETNFRALFQAEDLSVMGLTEVASALPRIWSLYTRIKQALRLHRPCCLVLIDAPDFHFRIAKMAYRMGIPVIYYISPQVWAWRRYRVRFLRRYVHRLLCIFPFEQDFFSRHGLEVAFVGHPLLEHMDLTSLDRIKEVPDRIGLLPGSRRKEISALLPRFAQAARIINRHRPTTHFVLFQAHGLSREELLSFWPQDLPVRIAPFAHRYLEIKACSLVLSASGTATLECAILGRPTLVAYRLSWLSYAVARQVVDVPYISMPNLILNQGVFPEYMQNRVRGGILAAQALDWLESPHKRKEIQNALRTIRAQLGAHPASSTAARLILDAAQGSNAMSLRSSLVADSGIMIQLQNW
ncbi:MAG: lipid-A-disaccharide synthase [Desulfovermiculus sp.]|nr:lipid-A-disaccharide synthase [Desulfovermiculus sp.]